MPENPNPEPKVMTPWRHQMCKLYVPIEGRKVISNENRLKAYSEKIKD